MASWTHALTGFDAHRLRHLNRAPGFPPFVDEHRALIAAPRERVWEAVRAYGEALARDRGGPLPLLLGTEPRAGFAVSRREPRRCLDLEGRHRFSRYRLTFELRDGAGGATEVVARTFAEFPGRRGRAYRALVIGSGGHAVAVRGMLRSIGKSSRTTGAFAPVADGRASLPPSGVEDSRDRFKRR
ncbi:hypothetical protein K3N28_18680 [Glycomyces sp. TRM65418]|uniref:hypothetical protein n=1 Tax=Glycomyces sp. TRM65418 TaxID=2867006 RepID=UPI001CE56093|nr:hypothetical protein [Glycomyces sp. TRM65418]MCC3765089.1 hypothetical protein [Glycomyces sp. TRM65418]QZD54718.1 hypothetical protein K3N28_18590 [Glycomyces sp. TRM65418]